MGVFDKELIINGKAVRSPEQQVYKNMEDIEDLQKIIKKAYTTSATLTSASVSVAINTTNAPEGTTEGWLMTEDGLLFNITGGDDTNLLITFYSDLRGPQGPSGASLSIDDSITSLTKVWSSKKTDDEIKGLIDNSVSITSKVWSSSKVDSLISSGIAWTTTDKDGDNKISEDDIYMTDTPVSLAGIGQPTLHLGDLIVFVDSNLNAKTLYRVSQRYFGSVEVTKVCDFAQGKQLYQHNITIKCDDTSKPALLFLQIINDDNSTDFTIFNNILNYFTNTIGDNKRVCIEGSYKNTMFTNNDTHAQFMYSNNGKLYCGSVALSGNTYTYAYYQEITSANTTITDDIISL